MIRAPLNALLFMALAGCGIKTERADLIIYNATIHAMDGTERTYQAMATRGDSILELGPDRQILNKYRSERNIDAALGAVFPGFIDAHCHFLSYGLGLAQADLVGSVTFEKAIQRLQKHEAAQPNGWLTGRGWDQNLWPGKAFPTNDLLNELWPTRPVLIKRIDGHAALANDAALRAAGIDAHTHINGGMVLLRNGQPTGLLIDKAADRAEAAVPAPTLAEKTAALLRAQTDCFALGLTSVADAGLTKDEILLIRELHGSGKLKMPVYAMISDIAADVDHFLQTGPIHDERLTVCAVKCYADGALGSRGACLRKPYSDLTTHHGMMLDSGTHYIQMAARLAEAGFQMNTHCIGDSAAGFILRVYAQHLPEGNDLRWRIEHAQVLSAEDFDMFGRHGIIPSVQPTHATSDMYWATERLGGERIKTAYAYESLRKQLGFVALGTDFPVEQVNPVLTFYAAVFRRDAEGYPAGGFLLEEALSRTDALLGMTARAALANREEHKYGSLEPGLKANFIFTDRNLLTAPEDALLGTLILRTFVHGEEVYTAP